MYHILEFNNGQPIILWQSGNNLQKYVINSGRIINRGIIRKDINKNFRLWNTSPSYISYDSVDGSTVVCHITYNEINEVFTTKCVSAFIEHNGKLYTFCLESVENTYNLYAIMSDSFKDKTLICEGLDFSENILGTKNEEFIILFSKDKQFFISYDLKLVTTLNMSSAQSSNTINLQNEVSKLKFELHQLEQHHEDFVREYDQLSAYAGELQEKLRKSRLNLN